jgi:hypothetical protein
MVEFTSFLLGGILMFVQIYALEELGKGNGAGWRT